MAAGKLRTFGSNLLRKRVYRDEELEISKLRRCLNSWDLTALGVGSTLGIGVYLLTGSVALQLAGPSVVLSFLIAAIAALFSGLCYAELATRLPRAGSAYTYAYAVVGEFFAFLVGWNIILEALMGTASIARGLSMYVDSIANHTISGWSTSIAPMRLANLSPYFDFFSFGVVIAFGVMMAIGVRESTIVNNVFVVFNIIVIVFVIIVGSINADINNWYIPSTEVPGSNNGSGGFFPYGVWGTLKGAAVCYYGFVGFDIVSFTGEEVREPRRVVPFTILAVLAVLFLAYTSVAIVLTMMMPYYLQERVVSIAMAFTYVGWDWAQWIVSAGAIFGILSCLFGALYPLPRLLYAMASDGLFIQGFDKVTSCRKSPAIAVIASSSAIATLSAILELEQLLMMVCVGTLLSYTVVAIIVILIRYHSDYTPPRIPGYIRQMFGRGAKAPSTATARVIHITLALFVCTCLVSALVEKNFIATSILHVVAFLLLIIMTLQPKVKEEIYYKTPIVPFIPCLSIYINIHLMVLISWQTWIRILIWIAIGVLVYFIFILCCKRKEDKICQNNLQPFAHTIENGKTPVQVIAEQPALPNIIKEYSSNVDDYIIEEEEEEDDDDKNKIPKMTIEDEIKENVPIKTELVLQQAIMENNEEKEATIIDLLDQVLQAEEESYGEVISLQDHTEEQEVSTSHEILPHRPSFSELSDAGSDASLGNQVLSKYDVIAQVHREDLPKVEEDETEEIYEIEQSEQIEEHELITAFNESDSNSRTDESGYSDTIVNTLQNESIEDIKEEAPYIPVPPPMDENFFSSPNFKKSFTISVRAPKSPEEVKPRESIKSNTSVEDGPMVFGSDRQVSFMSKLNNIFKSQVSKKKEKEEQPKKRSHSFGYVAENTVYDPNEKEPDFADLRNELRLKVSMQNLKPVEVAVEDFSKPKEDEEEEEETIMTREDLKSKLENIFANGGPNLLKPRLMKSNPPTPEEAYHTDISSTESIPKQQKIEKNDTLKRQKDKFGEVLNSLNRLSLNKDEQVSTF